MKSLISESETFFLKNIFDSEKSFLYHSCNLCYKPYVLAKAEPKTQDIKEIEDDNEVETMVTGKSNWERRLRSPDTIREEASSKRNVREIKYVICNQVSKNKHRTKFRLESDNRTENFVKVAKKRLDDVYECIADCIDAGRV